MLTTLLRWGAVISQFGRDWHDLFSIMGWAVSAVVLIFSVLSYLRQARDRRAQDFMALRASYTSNPRFKEIIDAIYGKDVTKIETIPLSNRIEFMAFFEELAYLMRFKTIDEDTVFYNFGGDAITAWNNKTFWGDYQEEKYWLCVKQFVKRMEEVEGDFFEGRKQIVRGVGPRRTQAD